MINEFSIIIPALNEEKYLPKLLSSITSQNFKGNYEVILIDGGSTDNTIAEAEKFRDKIKDLTILKTINREIKKGIGYQRNRGANIAKYKYLLFIDSDMILSKDCLNLLVKKVKTQERFIGLILLLPTTFNIFDYIAIFLGFLLIYIASFFRPVLSGMFLFTSKENHEKIGGFNEDAVLGEDIDYGLRSYRAGAKYLLFFSPFAYASTRRKDELGRFNLGFTWLKWYIHSLRHGPILDNNKYNYPFGHFNEDARS